MGAAKRIPERMCVACRQMKPKNELLRIVKNSDGVFVDETGKMNGRGAYICKSAECLAKARKNKGFLKTYGFSLDEVNEQLERIIER